MKSNQAWGRLGMLVSSEEGVDSLATRSHLPSSTLFKCEMGQDGCALD